MSQDSVCLERIKDTDIFINRRLRLVPHQHYRPMTDDERNRFFVNSSKNSGNNKAALALAKKLGKAAKLDPTQNENNISDDQVVVDGDAVHSNDTIETDEATTTTTTNNNDITADITAASDDNDFQTENYMEEHVSVAELQARLTQKIQQLSTRKRKPFGEENSSIGDTGNPESMGLSRKKQKKLLQEQASKNKKLSSSTSSKSKSSSSLVVTEGDESDKINNRKSNQKSSSKSENVTSAPVVFSKFDFGSSGKFGSSEVRNNPALMALRSKGQRSAEDQLKHLEKLKAKMEKKALQAQENNDNDEGTKAKTMAWEKATLKSEGVKVIDNIEKLKKTVAKKKALKNRSAKKWNERLQKSQDDKRQRQEKRSSNIATRNQFKKDRKQFGKKKAVKMMQKKRPGFEGTSRKR